MNIFEEATRKQLRFKTINGNFTVEDLWRLPLERLDALAVSLNKEIEETSTTSFITDTAGPDPLLVLRFEIAKHIINTRLEERKARTERAEKREERDRLLALLARKQDEELEGLSKEELVKQIEALK